MTRSKGVGRGRAAGSRRALQQANAERRRLAQGKQAQKAPDRTPTIPPHLQPFQTRAHLAELRRRKAARRAQQEAERQAREAAAQAERERLAQEAERHQNRPITILTASRWLGELPERTLARVLSGDGLRAVTMEDGSTRVRASAVKRLIWNDAQQRRYYTPSTRPALWGGPVLSVSQWALIFGAAHPPSIIISERMNFCPQSGQPLEVGGQNTDGSVPYRCSTYWRCDYQAVWRDGAWMKPPGFFGPWSGPPSERVLERRIETLTFAEACAYFVDHEAHLMPDFEIRRP